MSDYKKNSLSLTGAVSLGTGVMIGAGIFALLGQVAELSGNLFPIVFILGAVISGFSAYSYIKLSNTFPSAGGIAMYLQKEYGKTTFTAFAALLMAFSMVINESLVARTFGTYVMQLFGKETASLWVPLLGVVLIIIAFLVNISGNNFIQKSAFTLAILKVGGIFRGIPDDDYAYGNEINSTQPFWDARKHSKTHAGIYGCYCNHSDRSV